MSTRVLDLLVAGLPGLRHEPVRTRIRAMVAGQVVLDSSRALLVWEPRRVVPAYAVPPEDLAGPLEPADGAALAPPEDGFAIGPHAVLDPAVPFRAHTAPGRPLVLRAGDGARSVAAFAPSDPDLAGHVLVDFDGFDAWFEEGEPLVGHPRDPFSRLGVLPCTREVRVELDGVLLARSTRATVLAEGPVLPLRHYLPREDVRVPLVPSATRSRCAYKGEATYWTADLGGRLEPDLAWSYETPLREVAAVAGLVAFFDERVDVTVDGEPRPRPWTPWSASPPVRR